MTARADAKTVAKGAMVSYVMQLSQALLEAGDITQESMQARHRHLAVQKDHEEAKETQGQSKRRATGTTRARADKSGSFYAIWRRFLHLNECLRNNLTPDTANATIDAHARGLTEHLCNSWPNGSLWPWSQPELSRKLAHQIFFYCTRRTFGLNKSGWTSTRQWC